MTSSSHDAALSLASSRTERAAEFRAAMQQVPTSVAVVATAHCGEPIGLTVGSFASVSLDPILVTFFVDNSSTTWPRMRSSPTFTVNILDHRSVELCRSFSRRGDRFAGVDWTPSPEGDPLLADAAVTLQCRAYAAWPLGDHTQIVGEVTATAYRPDTLPLVFHQSSFLDLTHLDAAALT